MEQEKNSGSKDRCEKEWKGWWRSDRLDAVGWGAIFIWAALVVLAEPTNFESNFSWWDGWGVFFTGAGAIVLLQTAIRLLVSEYRSSWWWSLIWGVILLSIGLSTWEGWYWVWSLVLAAIGVIILRTAFARRG